MRRNLRPWRKVACWAVILAFLAEAIPQKVLAQPAEYVIGAYDVLNVYFWNHPELSKEAIVFSDGHIAYPLIGDVVVGGLTVPQAEASLTEKFKTFFVEPRITVALAKATGKTVTILGRVYKHGDFDYVEGKRLSDYVGMAGGFTPGADLGKTKIVRLGPEGPQIIGVDLNCVYRDARTDLNLVLRDGDTVILPSTWFATLREWTPLLGIGVSIATLVIIVNGGRLRIRRH